MIEPVTLIPEVFSRDLGLPVDQIRATLELIESGCSVSFIARYRKEQTCNLSEQDVARIADLYAKRRQIADRKYSYLKTIEALGKLTPELEEQIRSARTSQVLEDLYLPFRSKNNQAAHQAVANGLGALADAILNATDGAQDLNELAQSYVNPYNNVMTVQDALNGAATIIAERVAEDIELRQKAREVIAHTGKLSITSPENTADAATDAQKNAYENVHDPVKVERYKEKIRGDKEFERLVNSTLPLRKLAASDALLLFRAEKLDAVRLNLQFDSEQILESAYERYLLTAQSERPYAEFIRAAVDTALNTLLTPALTEEALRDLFERSQDHTLAAVTKNLRNVLLRKPLTGRRILALASQLSSSTAQCVAIDQFGNLLESATVYLIGSNRHEERAIATMTALIRKYNLSVVAIALGVSKNGEAFVSKMLKENFADQDVAYFIVDDSGAPLDAEAEAELFGKGSSFSFASEREKRCRLALSVARRALNPILEYSRLNPETLSLGLRQRTLNRKALRDAVTAEFSRCVNLFGVDLNRVDAALLRYVSGLNAATAKIIVDYRNAHGSFKTLSELPGISGIGESAYQQCAGFLRIYGGDNPLDALAIHPEMYGVVDKILEKCGQTRDDLKDAGKRALLQDALQALDKEQLTTELGVGQYALKDIIAELQSPESAAKVNYLTPILKKGTVQLESLQPGMELTGVVVNATNFGVFVDVGAQETGLVHTSRLNTQYVKDARDYLPIGQVVTVWVVSVDLEHRRLALSMLKPGTEFVRTRRRNARRSNEQSRGEDEARESRRPKRDNARSDDSSERAQRERGEDGARARGAHNRGRRDRAERGERSHSSRVIDVPAKPKKPTPLSEEMKQGKEPLRSFSDLWQFAMLNQIADDEK
ncbi:MAG: Tex-like N-terminal domain-containing protein [Planctomycetia bacterium]|nr:Tex-like N-terminal domain-containing protein [Planctomycetia bacterium]